VRASDGTNITGNDPNDAYFLTDSRFQKDFITTVTNRWGLANNGGVRHYIMDNEYDLWDYVHRDIHPNDPTKEEIRDLLFDYAGRVKAVDPGAKTWAPEEWGFLAYDYIPWLLDQMRLREEATGVRLLDICTVHHYCSESNQNVDTATQLARNISTRALWDPDWVDPAITWWNKPHNIIPTMKKWVRENYPGTQTGITEYNWGAHHHINGATAQADALGIFGREGLDVATYWGDVQNEPDSIVFKAMKMYRNYDGNLSTFGDTSIRAEVPNPDEVSGFASIREADGAMTVMLINKQLAATQPVELSLANFIHNGSAEVWQLTDSNAITRLTDLTISGNQAATTVPQQSITLFVIPAGEPVAAGAAASPQPADGATGVATVPTLQWQPGADAITRDVYLGTDAAAVAAATPASPEFMGNISTTSYTPAEPLASNTNYNWRIDERANADATTGAVWQFTTGAAPAAPTGLAASNVGSRDTRLTWDAVTGATSYNLKRSDNIDGPYLTVANTDSPVFNDSGLTGGRAYHYVVSAIGAGGESVHSAPVTVTTRTNLAIGKTATASSTQGGNAANRAIDGNPATRWESQFSDPQWILIDLGAVCHVDAFRLNWEWASSKSYQIEISLDGNSWSTVHSTTTGPGGIEMITLASPADGRYVRLTGTQRNTIYGHSLWEFEVYGAPAAPVVGQATDPLPADGATNSSRSAGLSWFAGENALMHRVYLGTSQAAVTAATPTSPEFVVETAFRDVNVGVLAANTTYYWRIDGVNAENVTTGAVWSFTTGNTPDTPTGLTAFDIWDRDARLAWNAVPGATSYNLKRSTSISGPFVTISNTADLAFTNTGLTGGQNYYYVISAVSPGGESVNSAPVTVTTRINLAIGQTATASSVQGGNVPDRAIDGNAATRWESAFSDPQWIRVDLGDVFLLDAFRLNWEAASSKSYQIQVSLDDSSWTTVYSTTTGPGGIEKLTPATPTEGRYVRLYGTERNMIYGHSLWEFEIYGGSQTAPPGAPAAPSGLSATALSRDSIALSWTDNSEDETGFRIERAEFAGGPFTTLITLGPDVSTHTDDGLDPNKTYFYRIVALNGTAASLPSSVATNTTHPPAVSPIEPAFDFLRLKHGLFVHYVFGGWMGDYTALGYQAGYPTSIDQLVDAFNVTTFADQVASTGVEYLIFTAYHANMNVLFPSTKMGAWRGPGHATASRDLLGEICDAMAARDIKVLFYIHLDIGQDFSPEDRVATGYDLADRSLWNSFMNEIVGEIGDRYADRIEGFWCDGAYIWGDALSGLKNAMRVTNPNLIIVGNNAQSRGDYDLGCKEAGNIALGEYSMHVDAPPGFPVTQADVTSWLGYDRQIALIAGGGWWSSNWETNSARYSAEDCYRYTVLQAGTNHDGGGVAWSAGCFGNGAFDPDFLNMMTDAYAHLQPVEETIKGTMPSASFPTPKHASIARLAGGFTATRSADGGTDFIHVLRPPAGNSLQLPQPADFRAFASAELLPDRAPVTITPNANGYLITLPAGRSWDALNTVIALHPTAPLPVSGNLTPAADTRILNLSDHSQAGAENMMGVYQGRDRTLVRFDLTHIPPGSTIHSATLRLSAHPTYHANAAGDPIEIFRAVQPWTELGAVWTRYDETHFWNQPGGDAVGTGGASFAEPYASNNSDPAANEAMPWDITNLVNEWVAGTHPNHGLMLALGGTLTSNLHFWSREQTSAGLRPSLSITYSPALSPLESWRLTWYGNSENIGTAADTATPHGNGISNLLVFGLIGPQQNPATAQPSQLPQLVRANDSHRFDFTEPEGVSGIVYGAEWSATLAPGSWQPLPDLGTGTRHVFEAPSNENRVFMRLALSPAE
jgi:fibronectin type 3 domain-containing protein